MSYATGTKIQRILPDKVNSSFAFKEDTVVLDGISLKRFTGEFWTSKQRQACSLHEVSYRACFKAELPEFFIKRFTEEKGLVLDPFNGRGTTVVESVLNNRSAVGMDVNPLSKILTEPRINVPKLTDIFSRLDTLNLQITAEADRDLSMFYHPLTQSEIVNLRSYLKERSESQTEDHIDKWIRMVATNRLSGHSSGFFSVYTLPPNQAATQDEQRKINQKRNQVPEYRDVKKLMKKKTISLLRNLKEETFTQKDVNKHVYNSRVLVEDSRQATKFLDENSVDLTVTSPPFLNVIQYAKDNWLRCWFNHIDVNSVEKKIFTTPNLEKWRIFIKEVLGQIHTITKPGGHVAFEVGEVRNGTINLDEYVATDGMDTGFEVEGILVNKQNFTKTSNIWGIENQKKGTNTNRIVLLKKPL